jgi:hypothetical protein
VKFRPGAKFIAIHKESNHGVVHEYGLGETDCFAREPFNASAEREMFALNLLSVDFADGMSPGGEVAIVDSGGIRIEVY